MVDDAGLDLADGKAHAVRCASGAVSVSWRRMMFDRAAHRRVCKQSAANAGGDAEERRIFAQLRHANVDVGHEFGQGEFGQRLP